MLLKMKQSGDLVEVVTLTELFNPLEDEIEAQIQAGQNEQPPEPFAKTDLMFPSGEELPLCWIDADYQQKVSA